MRQISTKSLYSAPYDLIKIYSNEALKSLKTSLYFQLIGLNEIPCYHREVLKTQKRFYRLDEKSKIFKIFEASSSKDVLKEIAKTYREINNQLYEICKYTFYYKKCSDKKTSVEENEFFPRLNLSYTMFQYSLYALNLLFNKKNYQTFNLFSYFQIDYFNNMNTKLFMHNTSELFNLFLIPVIGSEKEIGVSYSNLNLIPQSEANIYVLFKELSEEFKKEKGENKKEKNEEDYDSNVISPVENKQSSEDELYNIYMFTNMFLTNTAKASNYQNKNAVISNIKRYIKKKKTKIVDDLEKNVSFGYIVGFIDSLKKTNTFFKKNFDFNLYTYHLSDIFLGEFLNSMYAYMMTSSPIEILERMEFYSSDKYSLDIIRLIYSVSEEYKYTHILNNTYVLYFALKAINIYNQHADSDEIDFLLLTNSFLKALLESKNDILKFFPIDVGFSEKFITLGLYLYIVNVVLDKLEAFLNSKLSVDSRIFFNTKDNVFKIKNKEQLRSSIVDAIQKIDDFIKYTVSEIEAKYQITDFLKSTSLIYKIMYDFSIFKINMKNNVLSLLDYKMIITSDKLKSILDEYFKSKDYSEFIKKLKKNPTLSNIFLSLYFECVMRMRKILLATPFELLEFDSYKIKNVSNYAEPLLNKVSYAVSLYTLKKIYEETNLTKNEYFENLKNALKDNISFIDLENILLSYESIQFSGLKKYSEFFVDSIQHFYKVNGFLESSSVFMNDIYPIKDFSKVIILSSFIYHFKKVIIYRKNTFRFFKQLNKFYKTTTH